MSRGALVIGGDIRGVQTALDLADCGIKVTLVEEAPCLQANNAGSPVEVKPNGDNGSLRLMPKLLRAANHPNIDILTNASVQKIDGAKGDFRVTVVQHPRYVDPDICTGCGRCEAECPSMIIVDKLHNGHKAIHRPDYGIKSVPATYVIDKKGVPPCTAACPAGVNVQGYVSLISKGKVNEALNLITESVAFPRVLGRVCTHPCESECTRGRVDQPVSICALKRFAADNGSPRSSLSRTHTSGNGAESSSRARVAIIGAGPAGLTAARDLARLGHKATVFEALPVPGGMVTVGMPRFRLPREIRQADIEDITCLGIEIITSTPIGKELTLQDLQKSYEAILIAVGAHKNQKLGVPGEGLSGVINSITFLQALNLKEPVSVGKKVVVIGGGYTGIDSARTAVRLHCEQVLIVDRCAKEELAANREEVAETMEEGVEFEYLVAPVRIVGLDGKVAGVDFRYLKPGKRDLLARCHTTRISESEFFVEADTVIVAVGQRPDLSFLGGDPALTDGGKHVIVDPLTMATKVPGIFAAGDAARPSAPVIYAIADGRRAAVSIDRLLRGEDIKKGRTLGKIVPVTVDLDAINVTREVRQPMPRMLHEYRLGNFEEVDLGFTAEMALKEAKRCLSCAGCSECLECERACELKAIEHNATPKQIDIEVGAIAVGGKQGMQQVEVLEGIDITDEHSGIYLVRTSADEQLSPASAAAGIIMADLAQYPEFSLSTEKISKTDALRQTSGEIGNVEPRVGIFVCSCGNSISDVIDIPGVVQYCRKLDSAVFSQQIEYACTADAAEEIKGLARRHSLTHIVLAACSCCNLGQICFSCSDRRVQCKSNLVDSSFQNNVYYEFVNIREHCAWVHKSQPAAATAKAKRLIRAGLARAKAGQLQAKKNCDVAKGVLVVGGGLGGMQAAANLAAQGFYTVLIDNGEEKDNNLAEHNSLSEQVRSVRRRLEEELTRSRAIVLRETHPVGLDGTAGRYQVSVVRNGKSLRFAVGAIVVDLSSRQNGRSDVVAETELLSLLEKGIISGNGQKNGHPVLEPAVSRLPGVFLCGTGQAADVTEALTQGLAAASKASVLISKGVIDIEQTVAIVDRGRCRGCGTCESVCPFGAIRLEKREAINVYAARVEDALCRGCGICVARCPSGALSQNGYSDGQLIASLEAILTRR